MHLMQLKYNNCCNTLSGGETEADTEGQGQSENKTEQQTADGSSYQPLSSENQSSAENREQKSSTQSNENRTLGDNSETAQDLNTIDKLDTDTRQQQSLPKTRDKNQTYQHIKPDTNTVSRIKLGDSLLLKLCHDITTI